MSQESRLSDEHKSVSAIKEEQKGISGKKAKENEREDIEALRKRCVPAADALCLASNSEYLAHYEESTTRQNKSGPCEGKGHAKGPRPLHKVYHDRRGAVRALTETFLVLAPAQDLLYSGCEYGRRFLFLFLFLFVHFHDVQTAFLQMMDASLPPPKWTKLLCRSSVLMEKLLSIQLVVMSSLVFWSFSFFFFINSRMVWHIILHCHFQKAKRRKRGPGEDG